MIDPFQTINTVTKMPHLVVGTPADLPVKGDPGYDEWVEKGKPALIQTVAFDSDNLQVNRLD